MPYGKGLMLAELPRGVVERSGPVLCRKYANETCCLLRASTVRISLVDLFYTSTLAEIRYFKKSTQK